MKTFSKKLVSSALLPLFVIVGHVGSISAFGVVSKSAIGGRIATTSNSAREANPKVISLDDAEASMQPLMQLSSAHFASQALRAVVQLGIPDILGSECMTVSEMASHVGANDDIVNEDALQRTLRLLVTVGILQEKFEHKKYSFSLTNTGALLQTNVPGQPCLAPVVQHWMERPLWDSWLDLPDYIAGKGERKLLPFDRANGVSSDEFYGQNNPDSLHFANQFVRFISDGEVEAILKAFDWNSLSGKTVVDIGGHYGGIMSAVAKKFPEVKCICLDLPEVVLSAPPPPPGVEFVGGNVFDPSTIPACNVIFMKHLLDKCMWDEEESIRILQSCHSALPADGTVIIGEAVLPNHNDVGSTDNNFQLQMFMDAFFLLVGREGMRTEYEWSELAAQAGYTIQSIIPTSSPSCYLIVLQKAPT